MIILRVCVVVFVTSEAGETGGRKFQEYKKYYSYFYISSVELKGDRY